MHYKCLSTPSHTVNRRRKGNGLKGIIKKVPSLPSWLQSQPSDRTSLFCLRIDSDHTCADPCRLSEQSCWDRFSDVRTRSFALALLRPSARRIPYNSLEARRGWTSWSYEGTVVTSAIVNLIWQGLWRKLWLAIRSKFLPKTIHFGQ